ncbi:hypothetical protein QUB36_29160 [Microcoleus sp. AT8-B1]
MSLRELRDYFLPQLLLQNYRNPGTETAGKQTPAKAKCEGKAGFF